jgi:hypothetical protein
MTHTHGTVLAAAEEDESSVSAPKLSNEELEEKMVEMFGSAIGAFAGLHSVPARISAPQAAGALPPVS